MQQIVYFDSQVNILLESMQDQKNILFLATSSYQEARKTLRQVLGISTASLSRTSFDSNIQEPILTSSKSSSVDLTKTYVKIEPIVIDGGNQAIKTSKNIKLTNRINLNRIIELNQSFKNQSFQQDLSENIIQEGTNALQGQAFPPTQYQGKNSLVIKQDPSSFDCQDQQNALHSQVHQNLQKMDFDLVPYRNILGSSNYNTIYQEEQRKQLSSSQSIESIVNILQNSRFDKTHKHQFVDQSNHSSLSLQIQIQQKYDERLTEGIFFTDKSKKRKDEIFRGSQSQQLQVQQEQTIEKKYQSYKKKCQLRQKEPYKMPIKPIYRNSDPRMTLKSKISKNQILKGRYYQAQFAKHIQVTAHRIIDDIQYYQWKLGTVYVWKSLEGAQQQNFDLFIEEARISGLQLVKYLPKNPFKNKGKQSIKCQQNMQYLKELFNTVQFDKLYKFQKQQHLKKKHISLQKKINNKDQLLQSDKSFVSQQPFRQLRDKKIRNKTNQYSNKTESQNSDKIKYYFNVFEQTDMQFIQKLHNIQKNSKSSIQINNFFIIKNKKQSNLQKSQINHQNNDNINKHKVSQKIQQELMNRSFRLRTHNPLARSFQQRKTDSHLID